MVSFDDVNVVTPRPVLKGQKSYKLTWNKVDFPTPSVIVEQRDPSGSVILRTTTANDGAFTLNPKPAATSVTIASTDATVRSTALSLVN